MTSPIHDHSLDNGFRVLVEPMPGMKSATLQWVLPAGSSRDCPKRLGEAAMFEEYLARGAGGMSSREHSDALDRAGVQRSSSVGSEHMSITATLVGDRLHEALPLLAAVATDLTLSPEQFEPARSLCVQTIEALRDDPQHYVMIRLRERSRPAPFNRHGYGSIEGLAALTIDDLRSAWHERAVPGGGMLGVAGAVTPDAIVEQVSRLLGNWHGAISDLKPTAEPIGGVEHIEEATAQVHIGMCCEAPPEPHAHSMLERLAIAVLSGGMSGRLFTEVRERRSLCYSVNASYASGRDRGYVTLYAGTTPDRAQETLDVSAAEFGRLGEGVSAEEFRRAVVGLKSRLVMQGESTNARAAALCHDAFRIGRPRTLQEVAEAIDAITHEQLNDYLATRSFGPFTLAAMGPNALIPPG